MSDLWDSIMDIPRGGWILIGAIVLILVAMPYLMVADAKRRAGPDEEFDRFTVIYTPHGAIYVPQYKRKAPPHADPHQ